MVLNWIGYGIVPRDVLIFEVRLSSFLGPLKLYLLFNLIAKGMPLLLPLHVPVLFHFHLPHSILFDFFHFPIVVFDLL